ncbi:hypothetical protein OKA05_16830 [Luteolibacter arcticus]|uniref:Uncharacterized protein n=1 Tax=Luteolibacter arcticus TaxID=1581411 RepID=A0ABT3GL31_9BACT|nr:hypothetical protein [Luteolibacter arcticus]MCW1924234.1 hypothetical protein [Luteolibacter arcticus]
MKLVAFAIALSIAIQMDAAAEPSKPLHPKYPVIEGNYRMTEDWSVTLDQKYNRRIEDGNLVIWRPGFTIWTIVWNAKEGETPEQRLKHLKEGISDKATDVTEEKEGKVLKLSYRLNEASDDKRQPAFYGFAVGPAGHVQISIYFDDAKELAKAQRIFKSLTPVEPKKEPAPKPGSPEK